MKNLDLEQMGVQEMNALETNSIDGGFICGGVCLTLLGVGLGILLTQDLDDLADAYNAGYDAGHN